MPLSRKTLAATPRKFEVKTLCPCFVSNAYSGIINYCRTPLRYQGHMGMLSSLSVSMGLTRLPHYESAAHPAQGASTKGYFVRVSSHDYLSSH